MFQWLKPVFERKSSSLAEPAPWLYELFGAPLTAAGKSITPQTALRSPAVACAVRTISEPCGQLPVHIYRRGADGSRERDLDHPASTLLRDFANDWTSAGDLRTQITTDALLHGNGYAFVNWVNEKPIELIRLRPSSVSVKANDAGEPIYTINEAGQRRTLTSADLIHIRFSLSHDGICGESPINLAREAIALSLAMEEHSARLFGSGARPSGTLETEKSLNENQVKNARTLIDAQAARENAGRTLILPDGYKFNPLTFSSVDLQFLELRKYAVEEIARAFRVPPHLLFELGRATWGNAEELGASFVSFTLMYWLKTWEAALRRALFTLEERSNYIVEFLVDDLLRADLTARADAYQKLIASRVLNPNECRAKENLPPYAGGNVFANPNIEASPGGQ